MSTAQFCSRYQIQYNCRIGIFFFEYNNLYCRPNPNSIIAEIIVSDIQIRVSWRQPFFDLKLVY
jgi:hypothetical protein